MNFLYKGNNILCAVPSPLRQALSKKCFEEEMFREGAVLARDPFLLMKIVDPTDEIQIVTDSITEVLL